MGNVIKYPWENSNQETSQSRELVAIDAPALPTVVETVEALPVEEQVSLLRDDVAIMVTHTGILVRSPHPEMRFRINTPRGQIVPRGEAKYSDGSTIEFQDLGMPQPGAPFMSIEDLVNKVLKTAHDLGLEQL